MACEKCSLLCKTDPRYIYFAFNHTMTRGIDNQLVVAMRISFTVVIVVHVDICQQIKQVITPVNDLTVSGSE